MARRKHHKVKQELPKELVEAVNKLLIQGVTYREVEEFLAEKGHNIGKSSIQRYGKDFLTRLERLNLVKEQASAIVNTNPDSPQTEMAEAANQLAMQLIMETLMKVEALDMDDTKMTDLMKALALLERSSVAREKLKYEYNKGINIALTRLKDALKAELKSHPKLMDQVIELVDKTKDEVSV